MQVCENGHKITAYAVSSPEGKKNRCPDCGAPTTMKCPKCQTAIPGKRHIAGVISVSSPDPPAHCHHCGEAFPWKDKLEAIKEEKAQKTAKKKGKKMADEDETRKSGGHTVNIGNAYGSPLMFDSPGASQKVSVTFTAESSADLKVIIKGLLGSLDELGLSDTDKDSVKEDAEYMKKKLDGGKAEPGLIRECLNGIKKKLADAAATAASSKIVTKAGHYLGLITDFITNTFGG